MAARGFFLIETVAGKRNEVAAAIKQLGEGIKSVDSVTGLYDLIAVIEGENLQEIGDLITGKINSVAGVFRVVTCLAV